MRNEATMKKPIRRSAGRALLVLLMSLCIGVGGGGLAWGAESEVESLLLDAYDDYDFLALDEAVSKLERAKRIMAARDVGVDLQAEVWMLYGIVIHAATRDDEQAIAAFQEVLNLFPGAEMDPLYATPTLTELMEEARSRVEPPEPEVPEPRGEITHSPPREGTAGRSLDLRAEVPPSLNVDRIVISYRSGDQGTFRTEPMLPLPGGVYEAPIPGDDIRGTRLQYYLEAFDPSGNVVARFASPDSPRTVMLRAAAERPDDLVRRDRERPPRVSDDEREGHRFHVAAGLGTGFGLATASPRTYGDFVDLSGGFASSPLHFPIEFGFRPAGSDLQLVSFLRLQTVFRDSGVDLQPIGGLRARYFFQESDRLGIYGEGGLGFGRVAHVVSINLPPEVTEESLRDSTHEGPVHVGGGSGVVLHFSELVGLRIGGHAMILFPDFSLHVDIESALQFSF